MLKLSQIETIKTLHKLIEQKGNKAVKVKKDKLKLISNNQKNSLRNK